jgi:hypothetical protein
MNSLAPLIAAWDEGHREFAIAYEGLDDSDIWVRAHPRLLSLGELAGHVAYWQGVWTFGEGEERPDLSKLPIQSLLIHHGFRYYTSNVEAPCRVELDAKELVNEVMRVHEAAKGAVSHKNLDDPYPGQWGTWGNFVQYQAFHVAYHTGQAYSVRHLLGHETEDN